MAKLNVKNCGSKALLRQPLTLERLGAEKMTGSLISKRKRAPLGLPIVRDGGRMGILVWENVWGFQMSNIWLGSLDMILCFEDRGIVIF